ncbi:MAG: hypothetical protein QM771_16195 [Nitrospira sp.]
MNTTVSTRQIANNPSPAQQSTGCGRCGGMLVNEQCLDLAGSEGGYRFWATRCIQCGDLLDPVILRNRLMPPQAEELIEQLEEMVEEAA